MNFPCPADTASSSSSVRASCRANPAEISKLRKIATSLGTLEFYAGAPTPGTVRKVYDNLALVRAVDAFVRSFPSVAQYRLREAQRSLQGEAEQPCVFLPLATLSQGKALLRISRYSAFSFIDVERHGPTVIELPPGTIGVVKDMWFRVVDELGMANVQAAVSAKYLLVPPDYKGVTPPDCIVIRPRTHQACLLIRPARASPGTARAIPPTALKVYKISTPKRSPRCAEITHNSLRPIMEIAPDDRRFFEDLHRLVQEQPLSSLDGEKRSLFASIGIIKGRPFRPSVRMRQILGDAIAIGSTTIRGMRMQQAPSIGTASEEADARNLTQDSQYRSSIAKRQHLPQVVPQV